MTASISVLFDDVRCVKDDIEFLLSEKISHDHIELVEQVNISSQ